MIKKREGWVYWQDSSKRVKTRRKVKTKRKNLNLKNLNYLMRSKLKRILTGKQGKGTFPNCKLKTKLKKVSIFGSKVTLIPHKILSNSPAKSRFLAKIKIHLKNKLRSR
jgi:hypothetical protein